MFKLFGEVSEDMIAFYPVHFKMLSHTSIDIHITSIIYSHPCFIDFFTSLA